MSFIPQPESLRKRNAFESKTMWGIFAGYYVAPWGLHTGNYLIAEFAALKNDTDAGVNQVKAHRVKEVVESFTGSY